MELVTAAIEEYLKKISPQENPILGEMEERARREGFPIVGPLVGRILFQLVRVGGARRILELGSGFGYSAYWVALALGESGEITLTEFSKKNVSLAKEYFQRGKIRSRVHFRQGEALEVLETLKGKFDVIFNDVDKHQYPEVFRRAAPFVRPGGLLIADNVLWQGRVLEPDPDPDTQGILEYTRLIFESPDFFSSILPVRDGISISLKRQSAT